MAESEPQQQDNCQQQRTDRPSASKVLALATLLPYGASLLILASLILTATVIALAVTTPLFVIFSPLLLPAALVIGLAVAGFLTSGAFGVTSLSSFAWMAYYLCRSRLPEQQHAKAPAQETLGQRTKEAGESVISKAQELDRRPKIRPVKQKKPKKKTQHHHHEFGWTIWLWSLEGT